MNFPQIRLQSTNAQIEINTQSGRLEIDRTPAELSIQQPPAEMEIDRTPSRLTIDQSKALADVELKSIVQLSEEAAQQGHQDLLDGIARRIQEGEELMKIENGGNPIKEIAKRHNLLPDHEFSMGWIPSAGSVQINYQPSKLNINWRIKAPVIQSQPSKLNIQYYPGKVNTTLKQYASLKIDYVT